MPGLTSTRVRGAGLVVLAALCTSGAYSPVPLLSDGEPPMTSGGPRWGVSVHDVAAGQPFTVSPAMLCLTRPGSVTVTGVRTVDATGGLRATAFATGPSPWGPDGGMALGASRGALADLVRGSGARVEPENARLARALVVGGRPTVSGRCGSPSDATQLVVEVRRPGAGTATTEGVLVDYTVRGEPGTRSFVSPFRVALCAAADTSSESCR